MKKNLLLTGDVQVGKSTILNKVLAYIKDGKKDFVTGGFRSLKQGLTIYMFSANESIEDCGEENIVCIRGGDRTKKFDARSDVFDALGEKYFSNPERPDIYIMDELGYMESQAFGFQETVLSALESDIPVIGVIKPRSTPFLDKVRKNSGNLIIEVTPENREMSAESALKWADEVFFK